MAGTGTGRGAKAGGEGNRRTDGQTDRRTDGQTDIGEVLLLLLSILYAYTHTTLYHLA